MPRELTSRLAKETEAALKTANFGVSPLDKYSVPPNARRVPGLTLPGIPRKHFNQIIEVTILEHALSDGLSDLTVTTVRQYAPHLTSDEISKVLSSKEYHQTLVLRGVRTEDPSGKQHLSGEQMLALQALTDLSSSLTLERRLKKAGVTWYQYQAWLHDPLFRSHLDALSAKAFNSATAQIDMQLASGALEGRLDFIKTYYEITGRNSPDRKAHQDVQMILNAVVEIVTRNVKDSQTLSRISAELSAVVAKLG
jgi:hypothetical protein